ncbi:unnamed protein product [Eruca vesicaria subsp. sativa]|uniref:F-box domain-containing protein n=1 Tax=Eruca vesicaria subsp. sativa TaxID=29727 RepID=A0ABC8M898_ERUVS|nr:unnamed protein product [Eruca vesicaria subsp. sativa]
MDGLPRDLVDKILFRVDHRSLAMMRCTNRSLQTHINDPYFQSEYSSRVGYDLLHISSYGSSYVSFNRNGYCRSLKIKDTVRESHILGSCSGLLLLVIDNILCVLNPLTKKFRFFDQSRLMCFTGVSSRERKRNIGFVVNQVDRTTQSFKVVHMVDTGRTYMFEINGGNSWRSLETTLTCHSSLMQTPVYLEGSLHWLRNDGSIVAFNLETEQARLIPVKVPLKLSLKTLFAAGDNSITLISATDEVIYFYSLENILSDSPKWVLVKQILNGVMDKENIYYWTVAAYSGKCLVLSECSEDYNRGVHVYHLSADEWVAMGSIPGWCDANQDFFQFTRSVSSVVGLDEILDCGDRRISALSSIMALIDGSSPEEVENQLKKISANKKRRVVYKKLVA